MQPDSTQADVLPRFDHYIADVYTQAARSKHQVERRVIVIVKFQHQWHDQLAADAG